MQNKESFLTDINNQTSFETPLTASDTYLSLSPTVVDVPNILVDKISNMSYMANLGMMLAAQYVEFRNQDDEINKPLQDQLDYLKADTGVDYAQGFVAQVPIRTFIKTFNLNDGGRTYNDIKDVFGSLFLPTQWQIIHPVGNTYAVNNIITGTAYLKREKIILIKFNSNIWEDAFVNAKKNFTRIPLPVLGRLKTDYTTNLYLLLKGRCNSKRPNEEANFTIPIDQLMFALNIYPVDLSKRDPAMKKIVELLQHGQYSAAADVVRNDAVISSYVTDKDKKWAIIKPGMFKSRILDVAFKLINGFEVVKDLDRVSSPSHQAAINEFCTACETTNPTDLHFRYVFERGNKGRILGVHFYVTQREVIKEIKKEPRRSDKNNEELQACTELLKEYINDKKTVKMLLKKAEGNVETIKEALNAVKEQMAIKEIPFVPYMIKAVEERWKPNGTLGNKDGRRGAFNNFEQRHHDDAYYEALERRKLGF